MLFMKDFHYLSLDGRALSVFLAVLEEGSVSRAADRLNLTQSAVSHTLARLRVVLNDPLFVRSGRSIAPTAQAKALGQPVRSLLDELKQLSHKRVFLPEECDQTFTIAANDFQRDLIFPQVRRQLIEADSPMRLRFIASGVPQASLLREAHCDLLVTPYPPDEPDVYQALLFKDRLVCFFDGTKTSAPSSKADYRTREHIEVRFEEHRGPRNTRFPLDSQMARQPAVSVPNFGALKPFILGTELVTSEPQLMALGPLAGLDWAPLPIRTPELPMYLAWHRRDLADPAHVWLRGQIREARDAVIPVR